MSASNSVESRPRQRLPELFGRETALVGWQGITLFTPRDWSLKQFGGDFSKGSFLLVDDESVRLEVAWEQARGTPDVARSVSNMVQNLQREAKRKKQEFEPVDNPKLISRSRRDQADKEQITSFGWLGKPGEAIGHGWGTAWYCPQSKRVVIARILGHGLESPDKTRRLAGEILNSCCSHAHGGWQTWSFYDLQLELPEEFHLAGAKLQTGRFEIDWERVRPHDPMRFLSPSEWGRRPEFIGLRRLSAASVILENEDLESWARRVALGMFKRYRLGPPVASEVLGQEGFTLSGGLRDLRRAIRGRFLDIVLRRQTPPPRADVWQDKESNKIFVLLCDLQPDIAHVRDDVLDSIVTE